MSAHHTHSNPTHTVMRCGPHRIAFASTGPDFRGPFEVILDAPEQPELGQIVAHCADYLSMCAYVADMVATPVRRCR